MNSLRLTDEELPRVSVPYGATSAEVIRLHMRAAADAQLAKLREQSPPIDDVLSTIALAHDASLDEAHGTCRQLLLSAMADLKDLFAAPVPGGQDEQRVAKDAARYRWLRNESWAGYNQSKRKPQIAETIVFVADGAGNVKTILAEEALDAAIDAALASQDENKEQQG